jgi:hypothetical protein
MRGGIRGTLAAALLATGAAPAVPVAASTPLPKALLVDVAKGSVGGLSVGRVSSATVRVWGLPDYSGAIESPSTQELLWSRSFLPSAAWAVVTLRGSSPPLIETIRYGGPFRTVKGDRPGISLAAFQRHWPGGTVYPVVRKGVAVEYNVIAGRVVFAFDRQRTLRAIGVAAGTRGRSLCVIPPVCVVSRLG